MGNVSLVLAALLVIPWLAGCAGPAGLTGIALDEPFTLAPGQNASIKGEDLTVRFAEVVGDSRCATGVVCIWTGEVSCLLEITHAGQTDTKTLVEPGRGRRRPTSPATVLLSTSSLIPGPARR